MACRSLHQTYIGLRYDILLAEKQLLSTQISEIESKSVERLPEARSRLHAVIVTVLAESAYKAFFFPVTTNNGREGIVMKPTRTGRESSRKDL